MKKQFMLATAFCSALLLIGFIADAQALTQVANKINQDVTGASSAIKNACKGICIALMTIGIVGAAWKGSTEHNDGAKAWGKWMLASVLVGLAFGVLGFFIP